MSTQLFFDTADPHNVGWTLRYRDVHGTEQSLDIDAPRDVSLSDLAATLESTLARYLVALTDRVRVYGATALPLGRIDLDEGRVTAWRHD